MSTVVVVRKHDAVAIAADTLTLWGSVKVASKYKSARHKIIKAGETYFGVVGASAHNNVLASVLERYQEELLFQDTRSIFESYLRLHRILKEEYYLIPREGESDPYESSQLDILVANQYGIFGMYSWREIFEYGRFWALGSGSSFALGAMFTVYDQLPTAEAIAAAGIRASCEFDSATAEPFTVETIKLLQPARADDERLESAAATEPWAQLALSAR